VVDKEKDLNVHLFVFGLAVVYNKSVRYILRILISALGVMLAAKLVPGIFVSGFGTAVLIAVILGLLNVFIGWPLKVLTFPLTVVTLGFFLLVINTLLFYLATFIKGFEVNGFWSAFFGSLVVTVVSMVGRKVLESR
jgi:putative membrane protein